MVKKFHEARQPLRPWTRAPDAIATMCSEFTELQADGRRGDPLEWPGYPEAIDTAIAAGGSGEAVVVGDAVVAGHRVVLAAFAFAFMGGSMGETAGAKIVFALERARETRRPLLTIIASGGARVQEGMRSLRQMQRIAAAIANNRAAGIPHLALLDDPTHGGVWASIGASADVAIAIDSAAISFAGPRVRRSDRGDQTAYTAAGQYQAGFVDAVVPRADAPQAVGRWLGALSLAIDTAPTPCEPPPALAAAAADTPWAMVALARSPTRPTTRDYLDVYFERRCLLHGDRLGGADAGMLCGIGQRAGRAIAFVAQTGTPNSPAGFRAASRLLSLADRLGIPVLTLIDTPGAADDAAAETAGVGPAIAETAVMLASLSVPVTSVVVGEGGSGGAIAIASPERLWMTPHSYFSVIAPEAANRILRRDPTETERTADELSLCPSDLVRLGIARGVLTDAR